MKKLKLLKIVLMFVYFGVIIQYVLLFEPEMTCEEDENRAEDVFHPEQQVDEEETKKYDEKKGFQMNLTDVIDKILPLVLRFIVDSEIGSMLLPDMQRSLWITGPFRFLPVPRAKFTFSFTSGVLHYLSELEHHGPVIAVYKDKTFSTNTSIGFSSVLLSYDYFVQLLLLWQRGQVFLETTLIQANIQTDFNIASCELTLKRLELNGIESITIFPVGNSLAEQSITFVLNAVIPFMKNVLIEWVEVYARLIIQECFNRISKDFCPRNVFKLLAHYL